MSKEIIIDGVDVSGCTYYDANADKESAFLFDCKREHAPCWSCASMPGCLYKKYKRKKQECEELIKNYFTVIQQRNVAKQQLDQLKKANDEKNELLAQLGCPTVGTARRLTLSLKEQIDKLKAQLLDQEAETLKAGGIIHTLEQTLTEIKEFVKNEMTPNSDTNIILQKISECES